MTVKPVRVWPPVQGCFFCGLVAQRSPATDCPRCGRYGFQTLDGLSRPMADFDALEAEWLAAHGGQQGLWT